MDAAILRILYNPPINCKGEKQKAFTLTSNYPHILALYNDSDILCGHKAEMLSGAPSQHSQSY